MTARADWRAIHLFHSGDLDAVLLDVVAPAVRREQDRTPGLRWFFLRYWNGGPHVRLRIAGLDGAAFVRLRQTLSAALRAVPSPRFDTAAYAETADRMRAMRARLPAASAALLEPPERPVPVPTVIARGYRFDAARYGDPVARGLIERQFCVSSALALRALEICRVAPGARTGIAALFLAAGLPAAGATHSDHAAFLDHVAAESSALMGADGPTVAQDPPAVLVAIAAGGLERGLSTTALDPLLHALLQVWHDHAVAFLKDAERLRDSGVLRLQPVSLLVDIQHLMMNRLGVVTGLEPALLRLLGAAHRIAAHHESRELGHAGG